MKKLNLITILLTVLFFSTSAAFGQGITGRITNSIDGTAIAGVNVAVAGTSLGTSTNQKGEFYIKLKPNKYQVKFSYVGYETVTQDVTVGTDVQTLNFSLKPGGASLREVAVIGSRSAPRTNIESTVPVDVLSSKELKA
ncbi:MAG: carboxypeptidase-like regulatory domain-containing protein, partial [Mucilaginibacter sp.]